MPKLHLALALAMLATLAAFAGAYAATRDNTTQRAHALRADTLEVTSVPDAASPNGSIRLVPHALREGAHVALHVLDASNASHPEAWNATTRDAQPVLVPLDSLPRLMIVTAEIDEPGAPLVTMWAWAGRAHLLVASTPQGLAAQALGLGASS